MPALPAMSPLAKRRPDVPVEVLAARTLSLATLGPRRRAERRQESIATLEALAGASLDELRQKLPTRFWVIAMLSLMGKSTREIADLVGYAGSAPVVRVLRHPAVVRLVEEVRAAQLERVLQGEFGVAAAARAAAPAVIEHVAALAGGVKDRATGDGSGGRSGTRTRSVGPSCSSPCRATRWRARRPRTSTPSSRNSPTTSSKPSPSAASFQSAIKASPGSSGRPTAPTCLPQSTPPRPGQ